MRFRARARAASLLVVVLPLLAACSKDPSAGLPVATPEASASAAPGMDESLRDEALDLIDQREAALVKGDRKAFLATVDPEALQFTATQARWFDNLAQLPATDLSLELGDPDDMSRVHGDGALQLPVDFTMRLDGFDTAPVTQPLVYTFERRGDGVVLSADRNVQMDAQHDWVPAPWDTAHIVVRRDGPVLGIFDEETLPFADSVMSDLQAARTAIQAVIPDWSGKFVTYDITDLQAMDTMSEMSTFDTGGIAFPVPERPGSPGVASYRFMVNPSVANSVLERGFLFRHELVHVALGTADDRSPVWLVEGVAEYVSRSSQLPLETRQRIAATALVANGQGPISLQPGVDFYRKDPTRNYELAALVCDYLATTRGAPVIFDLIRTFQGERIATQADIDRVVRRELGVDTLQLARDAIAWASP